MKRFLVPAAVVLGILLIVVLVSIYTRVPERHAPWREDLALSPKVTTLEDGSIQIENVRNWTYGSTTITGKGWSEVQVNPKEVTRVWFMLEPFPYWDAIGHTYLTFEFSDGTALSFSIEAHMERDEKYSAFAGLWNEYELAYTWGTERDFATRRLLYLQHELRMYPLALTPEVAQELFVRFTKETVALQETPRFYNTLTENCTNTLAYMVNDLMPGALPPDLSWYLTGRSDSYLMKHGLITKVSDSEQITQARYDLTPFRADLLQAATSSPAVFSRTLRSLLTP